MKRRVRILPSVVQGGSVDYTLECGTTLGAAYLTHFKQRTSDTFTNILKHALGDNTQAITGSDEGEVIVMDAVYKGEKLELNIYDYYAQDFMNSVYLDAGFKNKLSSGWSYGAAAQYINQMSVGNADDNLALVGSTTGGKQISANAFGLKMDMAYQESKLGLAFTKVMSDSDRHDSLVLPWDGTPLFTNMLTSSNLFSSNYAKGLTSTGGYIAGTQGLKLSYKQDYARLGLQGIKSVLSYARFSNSAFAKTQKDINAVLSYKLSEFTLALKGVWVKNSSSSDAVSSISQVDSLTQYRVIADYKF